MPRSLTKPQARPLQRFPIAALELWHLASLDAPTVAVVWALSFACAAGVRLPFWVPVLLALSSWAVYVGDRLLDAHVALLSGETGNLRERHYFHWRNRKILAPLASVSACIAAGIVFAWMPLLARERNAVLAAAALAYFARVHFRALAPMTSQAPSANHGDFRLDTPALYPCSGVRLPARIPVKELLVGILFTAACVLPAWTRTAAASRSLLIPALLFALLAWLNCHLIESWESGRTPSRLTPTLLYLAGLLLAATRATSQPRSAALLAAGAVSAFLLALLDQLRPRLSPVTLRTASDLVLLTPLALLIR